MKKIYLMALTAVFSLSVSAQNAKKKSVKPLKAVTESSTVTSKKLNINKTNSANKTSAIIWTDDFSNASTWTMTQDQGTTAWAVGTATGQGAYALGEIASTSAANGFALFDSDFGCDGDQVAHLTTAAPFSCVGHPLVRLGFEQLYAKWYDSTRVYISTNGTTWTNFPINEQYVNANTAADISPNPDYVMVDISSVAGNQATVWVRFTYYSPSSVYDTDAGCGYNWLIDDVFVEDLPAHDVQVNALGVVTSPTTVAGPNNCALGTQFVAAQIKNLGPNAESNITVNFSVNGSVSTPTVYTGSIPVGDSAQVLLPMPYNFTPTNYYVVKAWTALATDGDISNDTSAIALANNIPTPLTTTTYTNGIQTIYDFASITQSWAGLGLGFSNLTTQAHSGGVALYYTLNNTTFGPVPNGTYETMNILPCMDITTGDTYKISFWKKSSIAAGLAVNGQTGVFSGLSNDIASMTDVVLPYSALVPTNLPAAAGWLKDSVNYVATTTETRYFAIGGRGTLSAPNQQINIRLDDIKIEKVTSGVGVKSISANNAISVFPNPTSGILNINTVEANSSVEVINIIGEKVYSNTLVKGNNVIDLSGLANGSYFVKLNSNNQITTKKVVLTK